MHLDYEIMMNTFYSADFLPPLSILQNLFLLRKTSVSTLFPQSVCLSAFQMMPTQGNTLNLGGEDLVAPPQSPRLGHVSCLH